MFDFSLSLREPWKDKQQSNSEPGAFVAPKLASEGDFNFQGPLTAEQLAAKPKTNISFFSGANQFEVGTNNESTNEFTEFGTDHNQTSFNNSDKEAADDYRKTSSVDLEEFQGLLSRLEASKKRQQRQKSLEGRREIYAQGLAAMMTNF